MSTQLVDHAVIRVPADAYTLAGFRRWALSEEFPRYGKIRFICGEIIIDMSRADVEHIQIKDEISRLLLNLKREMDLGEYYGDGLLVTNVEALF